MPCAGWLWYPCDELIHSSHGYHNQPAQGIVSINGATGTALYRNGQVWVAREGERTPVAVPAAQLPASGTLAGNFVDLIRGRVSAPAAPASCGLAVARLTEAAWKSAESGQAVML